MIDLSKIPTSEIGDDDYLVSRALRRAADIEETFGRTHDSVEPAAGDPLMVLVLARRVQELEAKLRDR